MPKIQLDIASCEECPHLNKKNPCSSDGWDRMIDWFCDKTGQKIAGAVEWHDNISIPPWCPLLSNDERKKTINAIIEEKKISLNACKKHKEKLSNDIAAREQEIERLNQEIEELSKKVGNK